MTSISLLPELLVLAEDDSFVVVDESEELTANRTKRIAKSNIALVTPTANAIPKADAAGKLDVGWMPATLGVWADWTPTQVGWTALPTGFYRWTRVGNLITCMISQIDATSNATNAALSLPRAAANLGLYLEWSGANGRAINNGTGLTVASRWSIENAGTTVLFYSDMFTGVWANSGAKRIWAVFSYECAP